MIEVLDQEWIDGYQGLLDVPRNIHEYLRVEEGDAHKAMFVDSGMSINPTLTPIIDIQRVEEVDQNLARLRDQIAGQEEQQAVRDAYLPRLAELRSNLTILRASAVGDPEEFAKANAESFGEPNPELANSVLAFFHSFAEKRFAEGRSPEIIEAARRVRDVLPDHQPTTASLGISDQDFAVGQELYSDFYDELLEGVDIPEEVSGLQGLRLVQAILDNMGSGYTAVEQRPGVSSMSIKHEEKKFKFPMDVVYSRQRFVGMMGHEGEIHIREHLNGHQQPLRILGSGLANYLRGSEGKGVMAEQVLCESFGEFIESRRFFEIARRYLSIGLARGADGQEPRDFKDVFQIVNAVDYLWEVSQDPDDRLAARTKSIDKTWELLAMRTLRGYSAPGTAFLKDKLYLEGNLDQWGMLLRKPELFPHLNLGKYDAANPDHISILCQVGILPAKLSL